MKSIGLCMIVKNEAAVILRCLNSVRPLVDYALIEDTGSTDGTREIIRNWLTANGLPGEVIEESWQDFGYNRSHALASLRERKSVDFAFIIDADDTLVFQPGFDVAGFKAGMNSDLYDIAVNHGGMRHFRPQLCSNEKMFFYRGVLQDFLEVPTDSRFRETVSGFAIQMGGGGARSQDPQKFRRDADLLERALLSETDAFLRSRYSFYLAQSFRDCGENEKALRHYLTRAEMGYCQDEIFISLYSAARLMEVLGSPEDEVIASYGRASDARPSRVEARHGAARYCRSKGKNRQGAEIARDGIDTPMPADGLFVERWIYEFGLLDEFAINAYWAGDYQDCLDACLRILQCDTIDDATRKRVAANARFAQDKLRESKPSISDERLEASDIATPPPKTLLDGPPLATELAAPLSKSKTVVDQSDPRRFIRLKEYPPHIKQFYTPSDDYVRARSFSLDQKAYLLETDAQGFIRGTRSPDKAAHSVVVLGDSVVESLYVEPDNRFSARLETILREECGLDVVVHNGGYSGATSLHMLNVFLNKIIPMKPNVVMLMTGIVDVDVASLRASFWSEDCWIEPLVRPDKNNTWRDGDHLPSSTFSDRARLLGLFSAAARSFDIELWFVTIPHQQRGSEDEKTIRKRLDMNEVTREAARAGGHVLCDLETRLADRHDIFHDAFHLNQAGAELVARSFVAAGLDALLRDRGVSHSVGSICLEIPTNDIHVINLDRSTERWQKFKMRNAHLGDCERVSAIDGKLVNRKQLELERVILPSLDYSPGALGCALSHVRLWQKAASQAKALTIFEDDTTSHPAFLNLRSAVTAELPDDWDIVLWGYLYDPFFLWVDGDFASLEIRSYERVRPFEWGNTVGNRSLHRPVRLKHVFGSQAYSISPKGARRCLAAALPLQKRLVPFPGTGIVNEDQGIDGAMNLAYPKMQSFICMPPLVVQTDDNQSDRLSTV